MRMLHWMCDKTRHDRIRNDNIKEREREKVWPTIENMIESRLMWFGYVERRHVDYVVRRKDHVEESQINSSRGRQKL